MVFEGEAHSWKVVFKRIQKKEKWIVVGVSSFKSLSSGKVDTFLEESSRSDFQNWP